jgi:hypothetical protein
MDRVYESSFTRRPSEGLDQFDCIWFASRTGVAVTKLAMDRLQDKIGHEVQAIHAGTY